MTALWDSSEFMFIIGNCKMISCHNGFTTIHTTWPHGVYFCGADYFWRQHVTDVALTMPCMRYFKRQLHGIRASYNHLMIVLTNHFTCHLHTNINNLQTFFIIHSSLHIFLSVILTHFSCSAAIMHDWPWPVWWPLWMGGIFGSWSSHSSKVKASDIASRLACRGSSLNCRIQPEAGPEYSMLSQMSLLSLKSGEYCG